MPGANYWINIHIWRIQIMKNSVCGYYWNLSSYYKHVYALLSLKTLLQEKDVKTVVIAHNKLF